MSESGVRGPLELSPDRKLILFGDESQSAGRNYAVAVRKIDGSPPVRLGEGYRAGLSPDGTRVLAATYSPAQVLVYSVGPGEPIHIDIAPLVRAEPRGWLADGKRVIICGNEPTKTFRCYAKNIMGGAPEPLTPDGFDVGPLSPDGRSIVAIAPDRTKQMFTFSERALGPLRGVMAADNVIGWRSDGGAVFVHRAGQVPARIELVDLATGRRTLFKEVAPPDRAGLLLIREPRVFDDGRAYTYEYWKRISRLFTVTGITPPTT